MRVLKVFLSYFVSHFLRSTRSYKNTLLSFVCGLFFSFKLLLAIPFLVSKYLNASEPSYYNPCEQGIHRNGIVKTDLVNIHPEVKDTFRGRFGYFFHFESEESKEVGPNFKKLSEFQWLNKSLFILGYKSLDQLLDLSVDEIFEKVAFGYLSLLQYFPGNDPQEFYQVLGFEHKNLKWFYKSVVDLSQLKHDSQKAVHPFSLGAKYLLKSNYTYFALCEFDYLYDVHLIAIIEVSKSDSFNRIQEMPYDLFEMTSRSWDQRPYSEIQTERDSQMGGHAYQTWTYSSDGQLQENLMVFKSTTHDALQVLKDENTKSTHYPYMDDLSLRTHRFYLKSLASNFTRWYLPLGAKVLVSHKKQ